MKHRTGRVVPLQPQARLGDPRHVDPMRAASPLLLHDGNDPAGGALRPRIAHRFELVVHDIGADAAIGTVDPLVDLVHERLAHRRPITTCRRVQPGRPSSHVAGDGVMVTADQRGR